MKSNSTTLDQKQSYLRSQIIDSGVDPQPFMIFMGAYKGQGENINLENWSLPQLKQVVKQFKQSLEHQLKREQQLHQSKLSTAEAMAKSRNSMMVADRVMGSNLAKKQKVFYDRDDLWDFQLKTKQQCMKTNHFFNFKAFPQIRCKGVEIKKSGGFFGFGAKYFIQIIISSNFSSNPVARRSQDADWLRTALLSQFPGTYIPPLDPTPLFQPQDKTIAGKRARDITNFLNSLVHYDHLLNNKYTHMFLTENDLKTFQNFRTKNTQVPVQSDPKRVPNLQGSFPVEISQRVLQLVKNTSKYSKQIAQIYKNIQTNMIKLQSDLQSVSKHSNLLANDFAKIKQKYATLSQKCNLKENQKNNEVDSKLLMAFQQLKNVFGAFDAHSKKQSQIIRQVTQEIVKYQIKQWNQFDIFQRKYRRQLDSYLALKLNLTKKKQQFFLQISKRELQERQKTGESKQTTLAQKQEYYKKSFPNQNKIDEQKKLWMGYINYMFENSFMMLLNEQQKQINNKMKKAFPIILKFLKERFDIYNSFDKDKQQGNKGDKQISLSQIMREVK